MCPSTGRGDRPSAVDRHRALAVVGGGGNGRELGHGGPDRRARGVAVRVPESAGALHDHVVAVGVLVGIGADVVMLAPTTIAATMPVIPSAAAMTAARPGTAVVPRPRSSAIREPMTAGTGSRQPVTAASRRVVDSERAGRPGAPRVATRVPPRGAERGGRGHQEQRDQTDGEDRSVDRDARIGLDRARGADRHPPRGEDREADGDERTSDRGREHREGDGEGPLTMPLSERVLDRLVGRADAAQRPRSTRSIASAPPALRAPRRG